MNKIPLDGIDGGNLLAFLAALGTLRSLASNDHEIKMSWEVRGGTWRPNIHTIADASPELLIDRLDASLASANHPALQWEHWENAATPRQNLFLEASNAASWDQRNLADWLCGIGLDVFISEREAADTPLRVPRADYLFGNIQQIIETTKRIHLEQALLRPWTYSDSLDNCSLKFEATEDRRYAFQWNAPTSDPNRKKNGNVLGANRLALEAIPLFTCTLTEGHLRTIACDRRTDNWEVKWSLWQDPLTLDSIKSVLSHGDLAKPSPDASTLRQLGILATFKCQRLTIGKTRVFTPSQRTT
jgi:CRISPR-associated endonuclease/helicase Cas3